MKTKVGGVICTADFVKILLESINYDLQLLGRKSE